MGEVKIYQCKRCRHKWANRKGRKPYVCPKCQSYLWDIDKDEASDLGGKKKDD